MNSHIKYIQEVAKKALNSIENTTVPVQIKEIAEKLGLKIVEFDFQNSISGVLKKDRGIIGVNKKHHNVRKRFTIAHELGHFLLGHEIGKDDSIIDGDFDKPTDREREANIFASQILMPEEILKDEVKKHQINLKKLAEIFEVSEQAMTIRLLDLDLIK